ncbi:MAG: O-antigen ligase family protein [Desulfobacteraceae bacterium]|nr:O-antigen ligase family protein [Desulfobacteraceae bacterium]MBC2749204.1 O-antigen ligase family protein [Desulfobacteraceae bacterium]
MNKNLYRLTIVYWVLFLFKPGWLIGYYVPSLIFLAGINKYILVFLFVSTFFKKADYKFLLPFLILCAISLVLADNTGAGRPYLKLLFQYYMLAVVTFVYVDDYKKTNFLLNIIICHFIFYGLWGIVQNGKVDWHVRLNEQNAFGPYMVYGVAFSFFRLFSPGSIVERIVAYSALFLGLIGIVLTFNMGSLLAVSILGIYLFIRTPNKLKSLLYLCLMFLVFIGTINYFTPNGTDYFQEIDRLINDSGSSGMGGERLFLWRCGIRAFLRNPIFGVGLNNFGVLLPRLTSDAEISMYDISFQSAGALWGFQLHNSHLQVLCELGIVGTIFFSLLLKNFISNNLYMRSIIRRNEGNNLKLSHLKQFDKKNSLIKAYVNIYALENCMVVYAICGLFYNLLFYPELWILLLLNENLKRNLQKSVGNDGAKPVDK